MKLTSTASLTEIPSFVPGSGMGTWEDSKMILHLSLQFCSVESQFNHYRPLMSAARDVITGKGRVWPIWVDSIVFPVSAIHRVH